MEAEACWTIRAAVVMPNHVHLLLKLRERLALGQAIARLKSKTKPVLGAHALNWQKCYYEHRLRDTDSIRAVVYYLYLNPYRAALAGDAEVYPWFWLGAAEADWFRPQLAKGCPCPEWLRGERES